MFASEEGIGFINAPETESSLIEPLQKLQSDCVEDTSKIKDHQDVFAQPVDHSPEMKDFEDLSNQSSEARELTKTEIDSGKEETLLMPSALELIDPKLDASKEDSTENLPLLNIHGEEHKHQLPEWDLFLEEALDLTEDGVYPSDFEACTTGNTEAPSPISQPETPKTPMNPAADVLEVVEKEARVKKSKEKKDECIIA